MFVRKDVVSLGATVVGGLRLKLVFELSALSWVRGVEVRPHAATTDS